MKCKVIFLLAALCLAHTFGQETDDPEPEEGTSTRMAPGGPGGPSGPGGGPGGRPGGPGGNAGTTPYDEEETTPSDATVPSTAATRPPVNDDPSANLSLDEPPPGGQSGSANGAPGGPGGPGPVNALTRGQAQYLTDLTRDLQALSPADTRIGTLERALPPSSRPTIGAPGGPGGPGGPKAARGGFWNWVLGLFFNTQPKCCCLWYSFKTSRWRYTVCLKWC